MSENVQWKIKAELVPFFFLFKNKGVRTVAVGIGNSIGDDELLMIAAGNPDYVTHVNDFDELKNNLKQILMESCQGK